MFDLIINSNLVIPARELQWYFSRGSGPGGQAINKTDSRVELIFNLEKSSSLNSFLKENLKVKLSSHLNNGCLRVVATKERSQYQNRKIAIERMKALIREGVKKVPKRRIRIETSKSSKKRRLDSKKQRGKLKKSRQNKYDFDYNSD